MQAKAVGQPRVPTSAPTIQIFATDIDQDAIDKARQGTFSAGIASDISPERLARFFVHEDEGYRIKKEVRDLVVFALQNMLVDPPFTKVDILCCRNLLIYLNVEAQKKLMPLMHYALSPGGLLILGSAESIGGFDRLFAPLDKKWKVFQRREVLRTAPHRNACVRVAPRARGSARNRETPRTRHGHYLRGPADAPGFLRPSLRGGHCRGRHRLRERTNREVPGTLFGKSQRERVCDGPRGAAGGAWRGHPRRRDAKKHRHHQRPKGQDPTEASRRSILPSGRWPSPRPCAACCWWCSRRPWRANSRGPTWRSRHPRARPPRGTSWQTNSAAHANGFRPPPRKWRPCNRNSARRTRSCSRTTRNCRAPTRN